MNNTLATFICGGDALCAYFITLAAPFIVTALINAILLGGLIFKLLHRNCLRVVSTGSLVGFTGAYIFYFYAEIFFKKFFSNNRYWVDFAIPAAFGFFVVLEFLFYERALVQWVDGKQRRRCVVYSAIAASILGCMFFSWEDALTIVWLLGLGALFIGIGTAAYYFIRRKFTPAQDVRLKYFLIEVACIHYFFFTLNQGLDSVSYRFPKTLGVFFLITLETFGIYYLFYREASGIEDKSRNIRIFRRVIAAFAILSYLWAVYYAVFIMGAPPVCITYIGSER